MDAATLFPLTARYLGALPPASTPEELVRAVCDAHPRGDIPSRAGRDLVRYEAHLAELVPARVANGGFPGDDAPLVLAPHVRLLVYGAALPEMLDALRSGAPASPRPSRGWIVLWMDASGKREELILRREDGWLLETFREPAPASAAIEDEDDRARVLDFWARGVLARA